MSEHSKSPWKASKPHKISNRKFKCIMSVGESVLAFVFGNSKKETETNAHLISAAPDMYEALKKCFVNGVDVADKGSIGGKSYSLPITKGTWDAARMAIAKAEGKS